jgi:predicted dienelactone hydrolase
VTGRPTQGAADYREAVTETTRSGGGRRRGIVNRAPPSGSRRRRALVLIGIAALAAGVLLIPGRGRAKTAPQPVATSRAAGASTTVRETVPTTRAIQPGYATTSLVVSGRTISGSQVTVPTTVWYPRSGGPFPLLVFSPGYQIAPNAYGLLTSAWTAAGYVVAEPTYPDTAPGAPPIEYDMVNHPGELREVISTLLSASAQAGGPLSGRIDPSAIAVAGHSDGGDVSLAASADTCCRDVRIKAAIILSGAEQSLFGGSYYAAGSPPLLVVQGTADTVNPPACSAQIYDEAPQPRYYLDLLGATHLSAYTEAGPGVSVVEAVTTAFLDGYLKGDTPQLAALPATGTVGGVSQLIDGAAQVPVYNSCLGAPADP